MSRCKELALCACLLFIAVATAVRCEAVDQFHAEWVAGQEPVNVTIRTDVQDGLFEPVTLEGRAAVRPLLNFLYFDFDDAFIFGLGMDATLTVEYYDVAPGPLYLQFDALTPNGRQTYCESGPVEAMGSGQWRQARFALTDAWLAGGENHGADLRLSFPEAQLPIRAIRLTINGIDEKSIHSDMEFRQALRVEKLRQTVARAEPTLARRAQWESQRDALKKRLGEPGQAEFLPLIEAGREDLAALETLTQSPPAPDSDEAVAQYTERVNAADLRAQNAMDLLERRVALVGFMAKMAQEDQPTLIARGGRQPWLFFTQSIFDPVALGLPWTLPSVDSVNRPLDFKLCADEFETMGLGLIGVQSLGNVRFTVKPLVSATGGVIPAGSIDVAIVKRWYQAGHMTETMMPRELVPELLLHDDNLIQADLIERTNALNFKGDANDPAMLLPFNVSAYTTKYLYVTLHAADGVVPGVYRGQIVIEADGLESLVVPVRAEVLPFTLMTNPLIASMYYSDLAGQGDNGDEAKYLRRLENMRDHGLTDPMFSLITKADGPVDMEAARREARLRKQAGVVQGPLLATGGFSVASYLGSGKPEDEKKAQLRGTIESVRTIAEEFGWTDSYLYGIDEASGDTLRSEIPVIELAGSMGGKVAAAVLQDFKDVALTVMHLPIYSGVPDRDVVEAVHGAGHKIMRYGSPQGGAENPWLWRYRYGLLLWEAGLDGGCTYAWRGATANIWDDFDGGTSYRDIVMTYPGVRGPVDTVQWVGYREAQDDLRYMGTLEAVLDRARVKGGKAGLVAEVDAWLARRGTFPFESDNLDRVREQMIQYIIALD